MFARALLLVLIACCLAPAAASSRRVAAPVALPAQAYLPGMGFAFQTYNNCGPAALSGVLGYYRYRVSQDAIRRVLRPAGGYMRSDVMDPFLRPYGLRASRFTNGNLGAIRQLVARGIPVIVLQWLDRPGHAAHFRVVNGYDDKKQVVWVSDSMYGAAAYITYPDFERLWQGLNREMIAVYPHGYEKNVAGWLGVRGPI